jgi:hypothetical protein
VSQQSKESQGMVKDSVVMARLEGLEGHARAAERRRLAVANGDHSKKQPTEQRGVVVLGSAVVTAGFILSERAKSSLSEVGVGVLEDRQASCN